MMIMMMKISISNYDDIEDWVIIIYSDTGKGISRACIPMAG